MVKLTNTQRISALETQMADLLALTQSIAEAVASPQEAPPEPTPTVAKAPAKPTGITLTRRARTIASLAKAAGGLAELERWEKKWERKGESERRMEVLRKRGLEILKLAKEAPKGLFASKRGLAKAVTDAMESGDRVALCEAAVAHASQVWAAVPADAQEWVAEKAFGFCPGDRTTASEARQVIATVTAA